MPTETLSISDFCRTLLKEPPVPPKKRSLKRSQELKRQAEALIPGCSQTFSKGPSQFIQGISPFYLEKGAGCLVWDVDGNEYLDLCMGLGAVLLGYADPEVAGAIASEAARGTSFTLSHPLELEVSKLLAEIIPCAQMVRFGKNGSDVTSGAIRVARAFTGRDLIACCGYHGWQDWYIGTTTRNSGIPQAVAELTKTFQYNNLKSLEKLFSDHPNQIAAVILEPVGLIEPASGFLEGVRKLTEKQGAVLVFDEVVTGFRFGLGGAQKFFGVIPDLACFGKGMANGMPVSAIVGSQKIMRLFDEIFFSFTFAGETASLAAAKTTIKRLQQPGAIEMIWRQGERLRDGYNLLAQEYGLSQMTHCVGYPARTGITFSPESQAQQMKTFVQQECIKRGYLFTGAHNICLAHTEAVIDRTLLIYRSVLELLAGILKQGRLAESLEGPVIQPVFRKL